MTDTKTSETLKDIDLSAAVGSAKRLGAQSLGVVLRDASFAFIDEQTKGALSADDREILGTRLEYRCATADDGPYEGSPLLGDALDALHAVDPKTTPDDKFVVLIWRTLFAQHWHEVFEKWQREQAAKKPGKAAATWFVGNGAFAQQLSRKTPTGSKVEPILDAHGRLERVEIKRNDVQLVLGMSESIVLTNPTNEEVAGAIAQRCSPGSLALLLSGMLASERDFASGAVKGRGAVLYTPARFGKLLGTKDSSSIDEWWDSLQNISVTSHLRRDGKLFKMTADRLIYYAHGSVEPMPASGRRSAGRPKALVYRIHDDVLATLEGSSAWLPYSEETIRPPKRFSGRLCDWHDALHLQMVLWSYARNEADKAALSAQFPWRRKASTLFQAASVSKNKRPDKQIKQLLAHLDTLQADGRITYRLTEEKGVAWIEYDVPEWWRAQLAEIGKDAKAKARKSRKSPKQLGA